MGKGQRSSGMGQFSGSVEFEVFGQRINRESNPAVSGEKRWVKEVKEVKEVKSIDITCTVEVEINNLRVQIFKSW